jgi:hypothetical protein
MHRRNLIKGLALLALFPRPAQAQLDPVQEVINRQIEAFLVDDFAAAFAFASPPLQRYFQTPENFARMVVGGYPMVWRPAERRFLDQTEEGAVIFQKLAITDAEGRMHLLRYRMERFGTEWRIAGVEILPTPPLSV